MTRMSPDKVEEIKKEIEKLKDHWPAHSVPPAMMERLDALEEELSNELTRKKGAENSQKTLGFHFRAIGYVQNDFHKPTDPDTLSASQSRIVVTPDLVEGLDGLEPGMALLVVFIFHRSKGYDLHQHPRGDRSRPERGVFSLRSPNRPNPIGITEVELLAIDRNILTVRGLDAIHGTPVLDLKPV